MSFLNQTPAREKWLIFTEPVFYLGDIADDAGCVGMSCPKMEHVWQRDYANHSETEKDITEYIVGFYNYVRLHLAQVNLLPTIHKHDMTIKNQI